MDLSELSNGYREICRDTKKAKNELKNKKRKIEKIKPEIKEKIKQNY